MPAAWELHIHTCWAAARCVWDAGVGIEMGGGGKRRDGSSGSEVVHLVRWVHMRNGLMLPALSSHQGK